MNEYIITFLVSAISGVVSFFFGMKKKDKEVEALSLNNVEKSLKIYSTIIDDLKDQIEELLQKVNDLEDKIEALTVENHELKDMLKKRK